MYIQTVTLNVGKVIIVGEVDTIFHFTRCFSSHDCHNYERYINDLTLEEQQFIINYIDKNGPITNPNQQFII
jgi:hypothetical protein